MLFDPWNVFSASFGSVLRPYTAFVTLIDLAIYFALTMRVMHARKVYGVPAPATEGPEPFTRIIRVAVNSAEQMVLHLPLLWIAAFAMSDLFAASLGFVWAFSRILYARGYYKKARRRTKGLIIGLVVNGILFAGAMAGVVASF